MAIYACSVGCSAATEGPSTGGTNQPHAVGSSYDVMRGQKTVTESLIQTQERLLLECLIICALAGLIATEASMVGRLTENAAFAVVGFIKDTGTGSDLIDFSCILDCFFGACSGGVLTAVLALWRKFQE